VEVPVMMKKIALALALTVVLGVATRAQAGTDFASAYNSNQSAYNNYSTAQCYASDAYNTSCSPTAYTSYYYSYYACCYAYLASCYAREYRQSLCCCYSWWAWYCGYLAAYYAWCDYCRNYYYYCCCGCPQYSYYSTAYNNYGQSPAYSSYLGMR
jgi:hypothetical protein